MNTTCKHIQSLLTRPLTADNYNSVALCTASEVSFPSQDTLLVKLYSIEKDKSFFFKPSHTLLFDGETFSLQPLDNTIQEYINCWGESYSDLDCHLTYMKLRKCCTREEFVKVVNKLYRNILAEKTMGVWLGVQKMLREETNLSIIADKLLNESVISTLDELIDSIELSLITFQENTIVSKLPKGMTTPTNEQIISNAIMIDDTVSLQFIASCYRDMAINIPVGSWTSSNIFKASSYIIASDDIQKDVVAKGNDIKIINFDEFCSNKDYINVVSYETRSLIKVPITTRVKLYSLDLLTYSIVMSKFVPSVDFRVHLQERFKKFMSIPQLPAVVNINVQLLTSRKYYLDVLEGKSKVSNLICPSISVDKEYTMNNLELLIEQLC